MAKKINKTRAFLTKMVEVLEDINTVALSDMDIYYLTNSKLKKSERISVSYWEFLKSPTQENRRSISNNQSLTDEEKEEFIAALRLGRIHQKINLTQNALDSETRNAYPNLWFLERKNTDLQLKQTLELNHNPVIQITAGDKETEDIIKGLIGGGDTIDIDHTEITKEEDDDE
ncbi:hypothetical protein [Olleya marilimosa]|uniref:hypothetical protein n=1 Tax=Olleya marilimosa TaxID=272164 RepID=UPI0030EC5A83|tara:strand:- start:81869 stop:82387 length:519 start_codon:yes stop_codon:yes gene_type:complete